MIRSFETRVSRNWTMKKKLYQKNIHLSTQIIYIKTNNLIMIIQAYFYLNLDESVLRV